MLTSQKQKRTLGSITLGYQNILRLISRISLDTKTVNVASARLIVQRIIHGRGSVEFVFTLFNSLFHG